MFSKAFLLCALVLAVTASDKIKKDVDDTTYDTTAYDSQTGSGPIWEKFRPTIGFTRDESGLQKTLSVPYNPFFQGIKVNVKPFTGGYVQIKANGAEIYKPLTSTATADPADTQEAEIIVDAQPDDEYYGNSLYRRSLYGDDIYTPYRVPVPAKYWRFPYYYPQVYQGQESKYSPTAEL